MTDLLVPLTITSISHRTASIPEMENFRFKDEEEFLKDAGEIFEGIVLLQTCNRIEVIAEGDPQKIDEYLASTGRKDYKIISDTDALYHLLELASGIDSMVIGEDQILGQLRKALTLSENLNVAGRYLPLCINKAIHTGSEARRISGINRGAISIGSAAVMLAEEQLGTLDGRRILVVGSGEMGLLVTQALRERDLSAIYVANRTFDRAKHLAEQIHGTAVHMNDLYHYIALSDVVICCTAAPHHVIKNAPLKEAIDSRIWPIEHQTKTLIIIDIAQPRDVESNVSHVEGECTGKKGSHSACKRIPDR